MRELAAVISIRLRVGLLCFVDIPSRFGLRLHRHDAIGDVQGDGGGGTAFAAMGNGDNGFKALALCNLLRRNQADVCLRLGGQQHADHAQQMNGFHDDVSYFDAAL